MLRELSATAAAYCRFNTELTILAQTEATYICMNHAIMPLKLQTPYTQTVAQLTHWNI